MEDQTKQGVGIMELREGTRVIMSNADDPGGKMVCRVAAVRRDGGQAVLVPESPDLKAWFVNGYTLGCVHWGQRLEILPDLPDLSDNFGHRINPVD